MRLHARMLIILGLALPVSGAVAAGCGSGKTNGTGGTGGVGGATTTTTSTSSSTGTTTTTSTTTNTTTSTTTTTGTNTTCLPLGGACVSGTDCCSQSCVGGVCNLPPCVADNAACSGTATCCSGNCANGTCVPLPSQCTTLNNPCPSDDGGTSACCSGLCANGVCSVSSFCSQEGDVCTAGQECCSGTCTFGDAGTYGVCAPVVSTSANCKLTDGMLCAPTAAQQDGGTGTTDAGTSNCGGGCCSRLCAPYGPTGVNVCQPATGCHVAGDLCTQDSDCCGGGSIVTCNIAAGATVGVCSNPSGCKPNGDVCRFAILQCNSSCDCCSGNCHGNTCNPDALGVPRCSAGTCVGAGMACASSADCCNGVPCVPNPNYPDGGGIEGGAPPPLICYTNVCVPTCGQCTVNADCCPGETCITAIGSASGICGPCIPPPDGGSSSSSSGGTDAGTSSSSSSSSSTSSGNPCSLYGQICTVSADGGAAFNCCNGVPCTSAGGTPCTAGETGCTCHTAIQ